MNFDFGKNWAEFSAQALTREKVDQSRAAFLALMDGIPLKDRRFLDIGFGQGLSLLAAASEGAAAVGCDINPTCAAVLVDNRRYYPGLPEIRIRVFVGSILDGPVVVRLREAEPDGYDIVHSWGVVHHTGHMSLAIENAASLVKAGGYLVLAVYNRHWSSPAWKCIKAFYNASPVPVRKGMIAVFCPIISLAKRWVTGRDPGKKERGMDFYYDVIDWVGGYPYEYASVAEVRDQVCRLGFEVVKINPAETPTGCNEYVFRKRMIGSGHV